MRWRGGVRSQRHVQSQPLSSREHSLVCIRRRHARSGFAPSINESADCGLSTQWKAVWFDRSSAPVQILERWPSDWISIADGLEVLATRCLSHFPDLFHTEPE